MPIPHPLRGPLTARVPVLLLSGLTLLEGGLSNRVRADPAVDTRPPPVQAAPLGRTAPPETAASVPPEVRDWQGRIQLLRQQGSYGQAAALLSLWPVDDEATAWFMRRFHARLAAGDTPSQALAAVQEEFRSRPKLPGWSHPVYWAAWQLSGDVSPLPR